MNIFSIDSSTNSPLFTIAVDDVLKAYSSEILNNSLSTKGIQLIQTVFKESGINTSDIDLAGAVIGPGSFTGLRIGLSMLKGLLYAHSIKIVPINSLRLLADPLLGKGRDVFVLLDAFMGEIYYSKYNEVGEELTPVSVAAPEDIICELEGELLVTGDFEKFNEYFKKSETLKSEFIVRNNESLARSLVKLTLDGKAKAISSSECSPEYFRKSAAELNYKGARS